MKRWLTMFVLLSVSYLYAGASYAIESVELEGATIIGNRELPKILYIMPWKQAEPGEIINRPLNSVFEEVLEPLDPDVFRRQLNYHKIFSEPGSLSQ